MAAVLLLCSFVSVSPVAELVDAAIQSQELTLEDCLRETWRPNVVCDVVPLHCKAYFDTLLYNK